jgi:hypothetical protein
MGLDHRLDPRAVITKIRDSKVKAKGQRSLKSGTYQTFCDILVICVDLCPFPSDSTFSWQGFCSTASDIFKSRQGLANSLLLEWPDYISSPADQDVLLLL